MYIIFSYFIAVSFNWLFFIRCISTFYSCNQSRKFWWNATWYPETQIGDCCSLDYDANRTEYEKILEDQYDITNGTAFRAIKNGFLDFLQGIILSSYFSTIEAFSQLKIFAIIGIPVMFIACRLWIHPNISYVLRIL